MTSLEASSHQLTIILFPLPRTITIHIPRSFNSSTFSPWPLAIHFFFFFFFFDVLSSTGFSVLLPAGFPGRRPRRARRTGPAGPPAPGPALRPPPRRRFPPGCSTRRRRHRSRPARPARSPAAGTACGTAARCR